MSVYGAMNAAVSGMRAQSRSLGNISDNIANSQTTGFKRVDTSFAELVTVSNRRTHAPGGVIATPRFRHSVQGDISQTQIATNMGLSGNGFFMVSKASAVNGTGVDFGPDQIYTRRGDFEVDKFGYLRNGAGYYLKGYRVGEAFGTEPATIRITDQDRGMPAQPTTRIGYSLNLPAGAPAFPSSATSTTSDLQPQVSTADFSALAAGYDPATEAASITIGSNTFTVPAGTSGISNLDDALENLANQIRTANPGFTVRTPNNGASPSSLTITGSAAVPSFTIAAASTTDGAATINPGPAAHQRTVFSGSLSSPMNIGDRITITLNNTEYSRTFTAADGDLATFLQNFANSIDGAGGTVIGPGETVNGVTAGPAELVVLGNTIVNRDPAIAGSSGYALNLANNDERALLAAEGSYPGGAVTLYDNNGIAADIQMRWVNAGAQNEWTLLAKDPNGGTQPWRDLGTFTFSGGLPTQHNGGPFNGTIDIAGVFTGFDQSLTLDFTSIDGNAAGGSPIRLTQRGSDDISVYRLDQDGYTDGMLSDVYVNDFGFVVGTYDNGRSQSLFEVPVATFASPNELRRLDGGSFEETAESGGRAIHHAGEEGAGDIIASAVEQSNVDIADEFTKMIVTQRAYSANSKTVRTADEMLEEVISLKR